MKGLWIVLLGLSLGRNPIGRDQAQIQKNHGGAESQWYVFKSSDDAANFIAFIKPSSGTFTVINGTEQEVTADIRFADKAQGK